MNNFNIGDKVKSVEGYIGTVVAVNSDMGVVDIIRGDGVTGTGVGGSWCTLGSNLTLIEPDADEVLPPAPKSVLYTENSDKVYSLTASGYIDSVYIIVGSEGRSENGIVLEPDAVLQLCHDLRRMAMQIKREQKQEMMKNEDI